MYYCPVFFLYVHYQQLPLPVFIFLNRFTTLPQSVRSGAGLAERIYATVEFEPHCTIKSGGGFNRRPEGWGMRGDKHQLNSLQGNKNKRKLKRDEV